MSRPRSFYDYPALYDAIHLAETPSEACAALAVIQAHRGGSKALPLSLLEPACGTGRFLLFFSARGYSITGYDINRRALAFARRRLCGTSARVVKAGMTTFRSKARFDAAFSMIGTFRHLMTDRDALAHLRSTARALKPGGVYVLGFDLADYRDDVPEEEGWEVRHRGRTLRHLLMTLPPNRRARRERIINFLTVPGPRADRVLQDEYDLRGYDAAQWRSLIRRSPFRLAGVYSQEGARERLSGRTRYALFALKKR